MSESVTHLTPEGDDAETPCCGTPVFELPRDDRMTADPNAVTCGDEPFMSDGL